MYTYSIGVPNTAVAASEFVITWVRGPAIADAASDVCALIKTRTSTLPAPTTNETSDSATLVFAATAAAYALGSKSSILPPSNSANARVL